MKYILFMAQYNTEGEFMASYEQSFDSLEEAKVVIEKRKDLFPNYSIAKSDVVVESNFKRN